MTAAIEGAREGEGAGSWLRLYIAGGTPNSDRAEQNLSKALSEIDSLGRTLNIKIIDVFKDSKRAMADGVIVTPTLVLGGDAGRTVIIGDLSDGLRLRSSLIALVKDA